MISDELLLDGNARQDLATLAWFDSHRTPKARKTEGTGFHHNQTAVAGRLNAPPAAHEG